MTRLNLNETCLLEASGELDAGARQRLLEYFEKHPSARNQFERVKSELELLRSLPRVELTDFQQARYAANIKQGIHARLAAQQGEEAAARRRNLVYKSLATISAAAAAVVIVAGILAIDQSITESKKQQKITAINEIVDRWTPYQEQLNPYDEELRNVAHSIQELQAQSPSVAGVHDTEMSNLLDALSTVPQDIEEKPEPSPGSL
jgi:hypothetical protein